jgi:hypothetical protein
MIKQRNAENVTGLRVPTLAYRRMTVAEKTDRSAHWVIFKAHLFKVPAQDLPYSGTDPGPAGFDWVEIEFGQTD